MSRTISAGWRGSPLYAAVLLQLFLCVESLYEDQAGVNDFLLENVGRLKAAQFHPDAQRRRLYFSTHRNFVGALESKTGAIIWRHGLAEDEPIDFVGQSGRNLVTISGGGERVRVWNSADGVLLWDAMLGGLDETLKAALKGERTDLDALVVPDVTGDTMDDVLVMAGREVQMRDGEVGKQMWDWRSDAAGVVMRALVEREDGTVTVVGTTPSGFASKHAVQIVTLKLRDGTAVSGGAGVLAAPGDGSSKFCASSVVVGKLALVCLDSNGKMVHAWDVEKRRHVSVDASGLKPSGCDAAADKTALLGAGGAGAFVFVCGDKASVVAVQASGSGLTLKALHTFANVGEGPVAGNVDKNGDGMVVQARMGASSLEVEAVTLANGAVAKASVPGVSFATHGKVEATVIQPYAKKDGGVGLRFAVSTASYSVVLVQADKVLWERHEALGHVVQGAMVDIPVPAPAHNELLDAEHIAQMGIMNRLVRRAVTDVGDLVQWISNPQQIVGQVLPLLLGAVGVGSGEKKLVRAAWDKEGVSEEHDMSADRFGFHKVIVLLSEPSVLLGVHSKSAAVVWRRSLAHSLPAPPGTSLKADKFFVTRATGADGLLEATVLGTATAKDGAVSSFVAVIHPLSGELLSFKLLPYTIVHAATVPLYTGGHAHQVLMVVDASLSVHAFPDKGEEGAEAAALLQRKASSLYFYLADKATATITGYSLAATASGKLRAEDVWTVAFPEGEELVALAPADSEQAVKSAGRVLGNRAVLLKYLNANLLAVATSIPVGVAKSGQAAREGSVRVYLVDTVVGAIIHSVVHKEAEGPVHMVQTENVVVYSFWSVKKLRHEVAVMELYENTGHDIVSAAHMLAERDRNAIGSNATKGVFSSWRMEKPRVLSQSYIMPSAIKALGVTRSMHGITSKAILMALASDQLLSVDKKFLDPRRPVGKPTPEDTEEGLVGYNPYIPVMGTHVLSYHNTINGLHSMTVAPARIESTCSVVAYGVDIFYTRVSPAKAYDCLGEDFNYPSLILSVIGLGCASYGIIWFSQRKELQDKWK